MEMPDGVFVSPVAGSDVVAFNFPFLLSGKALASGTVEVLDDGDLIIEGWAADFAGVDRQRENFIPGAFAKGVKSFMEGTASLNYHHKHDVVLGKVLDLDEKPEGLWMRARVDKQPESSPVRYLYDQVKKGTLSGLSVGGFFKRVMTPEGYRIGDVDMTEISVTNVPVHQRPSFSVVAGKALSSFDPEPQPDFSSLDAEIAKLTEIFDQFEGKAVKGDPDDLWFLATLLKLEQMTNGIVSGKEAAGTSEISSAADDRVDALAKRVKNYLDSVAREAHSLAAELGPLPIMSSMPY